jgi:pyridoxamine 5'-phosphate oxidase
MEDKIIINDISYDLSEIEHLVWKYMSSGASRQKDGFNHFTLSTISLLGIPHQRVVINRKINEVHKSLTFFTDTRSKKVAEIKKHPYVSGLFYDDHRHIQVSFTGKVRLHTQDELTTLFWKNMSDHGRKLYMSKDNPSIDTDLPSIGFDQKYVDTAPTLEEANIYFKNFTVGIILIHHIDFVYLHRNGNRRARFEYEGDNLIGKSWVVP